MATDLGANTSAGSPEPPLVVHRCPRYRIGAAVEDFIRGSKKANRYLFRFERDITSFDRSHSMIKIALVKKKLAEASTTQQTQLQGREVNRFPDPQTGAGNKPGNKPRNKPEAFATVDEHEEGQVTESDRESDNEEDGEREEDPGSEEDAESKQQSSETEEGEVTDDELLHRAKRLKISHQTERHPVAYTTTALRQAPPQKRRTTTRRKPAKKKRNHRRSSYWLVSCGGDARLAKLAKLCYRTLVQCDAVVTKGFSMERDAVVAKTRWQGVSWSRTDLDRMKRAWEKPGEMAKIIKNFVPIPYDNKPLMLLDDRGKCFAYRTTQIPFILEHMAGFHADIHRLMGPTLASPIIRARHKKGRRGPHFPCIMGHHRQYMADPLENQWQTDPSNKDLFNEFMKSDIIKRITAVVSKTVEIIFPGVARRFEESKAWHKNKYKIEPMFGLFWNLCVNGLFDPRDRVHCAPHVDWKNILGVCALVVYQDPAKPFDHKLRSWLVLWEAGVVIELPPGVILIYPSSLLHHFNVDVHDFQFVTTNGDRPTKANSSPIAPGNKEGRGTLVYFNQASMHQLSELEGTVGQAKAKVQRRKSATAEEKQEAGRASAATMEEAFNDQNYRIMLNSS